MILITFLSLVHSVQAQTFHDFKIVRPKSELHTTAAFGKIHNDSKEDLILTHIQASFSKTAELHTTLDENGIKKMRKLDSIVIKAGEDLILKPGGQHLMFFNIDHKKLQADSEKVEFIFKNKKVPVSINILNRDQF
jgi:periplasmic copper chaperone A